MIDEVEETSGNEAEDGRPFLPNHLVEELGVVFLVTGVILVLASLGRVEALRMPHIFFAGTLGMMRGVAPWFATIVLMVLVIFLVALPFLDKSEEPHPLKRKLFVLIILAVIAMWIAFTIMGF
ncbi:MAG: hypothetical protein LN417_03865 [Candidatus Thermoplasmatota archaeon]|nr:hypothetical protein [Candidatus Thermoplasmatota archaeon]